MEAHTLFYCVEITIQIADLEFHTSLGLVLYVYSNNMIYTLEDAYNNNIISYELLVNIYNDYNKGF